MKKMANGKQHSLVMPNKDEWDDWERQVFTPEQIDALREAVDAISKGFPWLYATREEARRVAALAIFPRSKAGRRQGDSLSMIIFYTKLRCQEANLLPREIVNAVIAWKDYLVFFNELKGCASRGSLFHVVAELYECLNLGESFQPKSDSEFFSAVADRLKDLETYKPTKGDFAIEELQNAFIGMMKRDYDWGKKGHPTKGKVIAMAKERLRLDGRPWKGTWTNLLQIAGLDFLPEGRAGRPSKREVDENRKAKQQAHSALTQFVNSNGGDWKKILESLTPLLGGKKQFEQYETDRLQAYGAPLE